MRFVVVLCLCAVALSGCARAAPESSPNPAPERAPDMARVVCERDGSRVLTPEIRARPDGVHFQIDNRLRRDFGYAVVTPGSGGMGSNVPLGKSRHVGDFPPGKIRIGCDLSYNSGTDYAKLTILKGNSGYKSVELECPAGGAATGSYGFDGNASGGGEALVRSVRRALSGRLKDGDVVEIAGYPEGRNERAVRVVRDGRVVFAISYLRDGDVWTTNDFTHCEGF